MAGILLCMLLYGAYHVRELIDLTQFVNRRRLAWVLAMFVSVSAFALAIASRSVFVAIGFYMLAMWMLFDIVRGVLFLFARNTAARRMFQKIYWKGIPAMLLAGLICLGGYLNTRTRKVAEYTVEIASPSLQAAPLTIALITDMHIGDIVFEEEIAKIVEETNALQPDMVLLGGDIFVETTTHAQLEAAFSGFAKFQAKLGVYYVPGNHEYYASDTVFSVEEITPRLEAAGITVMRDDVKRVDDRFYLVGREDGFVPRAPLAELMEGLDEQYPVIVLTHKPDDLEEAARLGVDLQLSGHTHAGQIFPTGQFAVLLGLNAFNHGMLQHGDYSLIVSAGTGAWGFPVRVGSACEIVLVSIPRI
ncbi:metallophosphoesterase [Christensenellaceae bacterium OttesenSCG-928-L17]|nr:metallophosphoesterase [Christensenellaceae bacterium OttesenSCG-928-L17]